ncbi:SDR family NAD(P)-dependent oxidoreductase [Paracoccus denitrificans]|uniref:SDR family NAD(P)-dependent oxidoreductase n=1 Tax=Paracoccus denitrificans TaxID=266 RepID=UPI001E42F337|nr:SDR family NAD(P)-dependent oxidoreductase [Paracoccus denitrificans]UFS65315.1 SDR family NAD(P)-dependent oxidoreductase [Paracoccus denitrificans]
MARIFVSGSTTGLGLIAGKRLLAGGHAVIFHARNEARAADLGRELADARRASIVIGDLGVIEETRAVAGQVNALGPVDAAIHNAGVGYGGAPRQTADGLPDTFAVNVLAPYILTALIKGPTRLVYLGSSMHHVAPNLEDALWRNRRWNGSQAYSESKLYVTALAFAIARLRPHIRSNAVDPGWVPTRMGGSGAPDNLEEGAATQIILASGGDDRLSLLTGQYLHHMEVRQPARAVRDVALQHGILDLCAEISEVSL